jgi:hypothetical protein
MSETGPEASGEDLTTEEVLKILRELGSGGRVDFTDEDEAHVAVMEPDEAVAYLMLALAEAGEDPEAFLLDSAIAQWIEPDEEPENG